MKLFALCQKVQVFSKKKKKKNNFNLHFVCQVTMKSDVKTPASKLK